MCIYYGVMKYSLSATAPHRSKAIVREMGTISCTAYPLASTARNTAAELERLIQERVNRPERAYVIDALIQSTFVTTQAIMVVNVPGFSRRSQAQGIIAALAELEQLRRIGIPLIETHEGSLLKIEADNVYVVFPTVNQAFAAANRMVQQASAVHIQVRIGIGYGDLLIYHGKHYSSAYGEEFDLASKLGTDLAETGQILLTEDAFHRLEEKSDSWFMQERKRSGLTLRVYKERLSGGLSATWQLVAKSAAWVRSRKLNRLNKLDT